MKLFSKSFITFALGAMCLLHLAQAENVTVTSTSTEATLKNVTTETQPPKVSPTTVKLETKSEPATSAPTTTNSPASPPVPSTSAPDDLKVRSSVTSQDSASTAKRDGVYTTTKPTTTTKRAPSSPKADTSTSAPVTPTTTTTTAPSPTTTIAVEVKAPEALMDAPPPAPELGPIVKLIPGEIRPAVLKSRRGRKYYAFKGIPYAIRTDQFQRFKEAGPAGDWSGVLNATEYGPSCIQYNILTEQVEGEEDCLHLNIFTPKLQLNKKSQTRRFPVMVFFHQGAFMFGTSKDFEERYMMDEDVVLVTVNYRLGVFGFLNTEGGSDAKGNMGLKDQVIALQFVRDNIHHFNGEANTVTIFGESAGGASVHYHLLSERSKGLFTRAISMSGTALSPWAFTRSPRKMAKKLGTYLNCPTTDMSELFTCLQGHDARVIAAKMKDLYEWNTDPITPFAPSVEVDDSLSAFITQTPYQLMKNGQINDAAPWMVGVVEDVCLLDAWSVLQVPQLLEDINVDWHRIAPTTFMFKDTALEPDAVSNQIRAYYFGTKDIGNSTAANLTNLYSDRYFNHGIRTAALMHVQTNEAIPVYMYVFTYRGKQSHTKFALGDDAEIIGVSEGDELRFLFNTQRFKDIELNTTDGDISERFVKLWVSFARDGKPTAVWSNQEWTRITPDQVKGDEALMYYSINDKCGFIEEPFSSRMNFWDTLPLNENGNEIMGSYVQQDDTQMEDFLSSLI